MQEYSKIQRKIISHPKEALAEVRLLLHRHTGRANTCLKCGVVGGQHIHHTLSSGVIHYRCTHCSKTYSEFLGTPLYRSKLKPTEWLTALLEMATATGGVSGSSLGKKLGRSRKTGWKLLSRIRGIWSNKRLESLPNQSVFSGETEADEAWFGRKENQEIVLGIVQRSPRRVRLTSVVNVRERTLWPIVKSTIKPGSLFCTDRRIGYAIAGIHYHHGTNNHSKGEYGHRHINKAGVELMIHSNSIEQLWGQFKGVIRAIHHGVSRKYRMSYLNEQVLRYEHGKHDNLYYYFLSLLLIPTFSGT